MRNQHPKRQLSHSRVLLDLLESVERNGAGSQRNRAREFGVALGLVNAYLRYCVRKGLIRVKKIPAKRYAYYLTPKGFTEKSRLAVQLVSSSLQSFRLARLQYNEGFRLLRKRGASRVLLVGLSELTDIAIVSAAESGVQLAGILGREDSIEYVGLPVNADISRFADAFDGAAITDLADPASSYAHITRFLDRKRIVVPTLLGVPRLQQETEE